MHSCAKILAYLEVEYRDKHFEYNFIAVLKEIHLRLRKLLKTQIFRQIFDFRSDSGNYV